jgi:hypothetical protein
VGGARPAAASAAEQGRLALTETAIAGRTGRASRTIPRQLSEHVTEGALTDAAGLAWKRLLDSSLRPGRRVRAANYSVSAQLQLDGMESTVVVVRASQTAATAAAVGLLGLHENEVGPGDIADAFGEIVVAISCEVRTLLAGLTKLAAPVVVQGDRLNTAIPGARMMCEANLRSSAGPVHVSLWRPRAARRPLG